MKGEVAIIVPIKFRSRRVKSKNLRLINGIPLYQKIFTQLCKLEKDWDIFIYSSNIQCAYELDERVRYLPRPRYLDSDSIGANELFTYSANVLPHKIQCIVHPTCIFLTSDSIQECIEAVIHGDYDSAFSAEEIRSYAWYKSKPLNYDPYDISQTQQLEPVLVENSGVYVYTKEYYAKYGTRIGEKPYIKVVTKKESLDIDTEEEMEQAKLMSSSHCFVGDEVYSEAEMCLRAFPLIDHIVFNFDGVIADTMPMIRRVWNNIIEALENKVNIPSFEKYQEHLGKPLLDSLASVEIDQVYWDEIIELYFKESVTAEKSVKLFNGVRRLIECLTFDNKQLSIYTSMSRNILENIQAYQLIKHHFNCILTADKLPDALIGKPSGDGLKYISEKTCFHGTQSLYIGDSYSDALEAKNANYLFIRASWGKMCDQNYLPHEIISFIPSQIYEIMTT